MLRTALRNAGREQAAAERAERLAGRAADLATLGKFTVLLADPPWEESRPRSASRAIGNHYPTMPTEMIKKLKVPAADDAALWLWCGGAMLPEALAVMAAWGFRYRSNIVWVKPSPGMGIWVRAQHEHLLIGARGAMPLPASLPASVVHAPRGEHSAKPGEFYDLIEAAHPGLPCCELFARQRRPGWEAWGNELAGEWERAAEHNRQVFARRDAKEQR